MRQVIHDLAQYDVAGVQALLREEPDVCVRASIDAFGVVETKPERHGSIRRLVAAVGASAGLLVSPPALAGHARANGSIVGVAEVSGAKTVTARREDGVSYKAR
jgi:hypothetical protein